MIEAVSNICETICLTSLAYGDFEYFDITCMNDLKEAYEDFDNRIAHNTDIELQYIDGVLFGSSIEVFRDILELAEEFDAAIEIIRDIYNITCNLNDTRTILENENYMYFIANSKENAFIEYLEETSFFEGIPDRIINYLDYKSIMRDFEIEGLTIENVSYNKYLFII